MLGGASVAVQDGDWVYVGAWAGDRIVRRRADPQTTRLRSSRGCGRIREPL